MKKIFLILLIFLVAGILFWLSSSRNIEMAGDATLSWNASAETNIAGYRIYYGTQKRSKDCPSAGEYAKKVDIGNRTSYKLNNLQDGTTYYFSVTSYDTNGKESCFSEEMKKTISVSKWQKLKKMFNNA